MCGEMHRKLARGSHPHKVFQAKVFVIGAQSVQVYREGAPELGLFGHPFTLRID